MSSSTKTKSTREASLLLLAGVAVLLILIPVGIQQLRPPLQLLEWKLQNFIHSSATPAPLRGDIVVVGVDDASMNLANGSAFPEDIEKSKALQLMNKGWPWSREVYAEVIKKLLGAGAKVVMLDFIFDGPSGSHPEGDAAFKQVLDDHPHQVVAAASFADVLGTNGITHFLKKPWNGFIADSTPPADNVAFINYWPDADETVRWSRYRRSASLEDAGRPDLASTDLMLSAPARTLTFAGFGDAVPQDDKRHYIRFGMPGTYPIVSVHELFIPDIWESNYASGEVFKDKMVLIGNVAPQEQDFHTTPTGRMTGVEVHAHVASAALTGSFLTLAPQWFTVLSIILAGLFVWLLIAWWRRPLGVAMVLIASLGALLLGDWAAFEYANFVVDGVAPMLTIGLTGALGLAYDFVLERRQRKQLGEYLTRYFSPDVVALMMRDPEHLRTLQNGATRTVTVLFSDLRGFTTLSEKLTPQQLVTQLNEYFSAMVGLIHVQRGGIDKFIGDAIMAVWGWVGYDNTDSAARQDAIDAVKATLQMRTGLRDLNTRWAERDIGELKIGVGIHQGEAVVGDLGSSNSQRGFTVIGDSVNTASRLEGVTKEYGVDNIISEIVWNQVKDTFVCRSADLVRVKGKLIPTPIYTVLHPIEQGEPPGHAAYEEAMTQYRKGDFSNARVLFEAAASAGLDDYLTQLYLKRCKEYLENPPENWDGVYVMTKK